MSSAFGYFAATKIWVFRNGDVFSAPKKLVVTPRLYKNFEQFLHSLSNEISLLNGAVRKVFKMCGTQVVNLEDLEPNVHYVATGGESYKNVNYQTQVALVGQLEKLETKQEFWRRIRERREKMDDQCVHNHDATPEKPIFRATSKGYRVTLFRNGDFNDPGKRWLFNSRNAKTFDELLRNTSDFVRLPNGAVNKLYDVETAKRVTKLSDLRNNQNIVTASSAEVFKRGPYLISQLSVTPSAIPTPRNLDYKDPDHITRKICFYTNGDAYHNGYVIPVTAHRFPELKKLLDYINKELCLPVKIHKLYTTSGYRVKDVAALVHDEGYVMVLGSDAFISCSYNVNSLHSRTNTETGYGLQGQTLHNEFMPQIRRSRKNTVSSTSTNNHRSANSQPRQMFIASKVEEKKQEPHVEHRNLQSLAPAQTPLASTNISKAGNVTIGKIQDEDLIAAYNAGIFKGVSKSNRSTMPQPSRKSIGPFTQISNVSKSDNTSRRQMNEVEEDDSARATGDEEYGTNTPVKQFMSSTAIHKQNERKIAGPARISSETEQPESTDKDHVRLGKNVGKQEYESEQIKKNSNKDLNESPRGVQAVATKPKSPPQKTQIPSPVTSPNLTQENLNDQTAVVQLTQVIRDTNSNIPTSVPNRPTSNQAVKTKTAEFALQAKKSRSSGSSEWDVSTVSNVQQHTKERSTKIAHVTAIEEPAVVELQPQSKSLAAVTSSQQLQNEELVSEKNPSPLASPKDQRHVSKFSTKTSVEEGAEEPVVFEGQSQSELSTAVELPEHIRKKEQAAAKTSSPTTSPIASPMSQRHMKQTLTKKADVEATDEPFVSEPEFQAEVHGVETSPKQPRKEEHVTEKDAFPSTSPNLQRHVKGSFVELVKQGIQEVTEVTQPQAEPSLIPSPKLSRKEEVAFTEHTIYSKTISSPKAKRYMKEPSAKQIVAPVEAINQSQAEESKSISTPKLALDEELVAMQYASPMISPRLKRHAKELSAESNYVASTSQEAHLAQKESLNEKEIEATTETNIVHI